MNIGRAATMTAAVSRASKIHAREGRRRLGVWLVMRRYSFCERSRVEVLKASTCPRGRFRASGVDPELLPERGGQHVDAVSQSNRRDVAVCDRAAHCHLAKSEDRHRVVHVHRGLGTESVQCLIVPREPVLSRHQVFSFRVVDTPTVPRTYLTKECARNKLLRMGLTADRTATGATITGMRDLPGWSVTVNFATNAVTLTPPPRRHVDAIQWRKVNIGHVLRAADALRQGEAIQVLLSALAGNAGDPSSSSRGGKRAHLQRVAQVYRLAIEHDIPPRDALSEHFEAEPRTTQRWITDARKAGLLYPTYREEVARAQSYEGADGEMHQSPGHNVQGIPASQTEYDKFVDLLNSPEHQKRRGRVTSKESTAGRKTES